MSLRKDCEHHRINRNIYRSFTVIVWRFQISGALQVDSDDAEDEDVFLQPDEYMQETEEPEASFGVARDAVGAGSARDAVGAGSARDAVGAGSARDAVGAGSARDAVGAGSARDAVGAGSARDTDEVVCDTDNTAERDPVPLTEL